MQAFNSTDDLSSSTYSEAFRHFGGLIDFQVAGTPSGATATLVMCPSDSDPRVAANYAAAHPDAALADADAWQGSLPPCTVAVLVTDGDGSTALDIYVNQVEQDQIGLEPLGYTPA
jgi:hypothetical protein